MADYFVSKSYARVFGAFVLLSGIIVLLAFALRPRRAEDATFRVHLEKRPVDPTVLDCAGNTFVHWAADVHGQHPTRCIFSGNLTLQSAVTESYVAELCARRNDCGGYTVSTVQPSEACLASCGDEAGTRPGETTCLASTYNRGAPEYALVPRSAVRDLTSTGHNTDGSRFPTRVRTVEVLM